MADVLVVVVVVVFVTFVTAAMLFWPLLYLLRKFMLELCFCIVVVVVVALNTLAVVWFSKFFGFCFAYAAEGVDDCF